MALHILFSVKEEGMTKKKKTLVYAHAIPHEKEHEKEEDKLRTTNAQHKHIHYAILDSLSKNKQHATKNIEGASPPLQSDVLVRVRNEEVFQRSTRKRRWEEKKKKTRKRSCEGEGRGRKGGKRH
jgi:Cu2+-containing amine oxidase